MKKLPAINAQYWALIISATTLGETGADLISQSLNLGFGGGALFLFSLLIIITLLAVMTKVSRNLCYWLAIIVTHPMGATLGDFMTKAEGLSLGNVSATVMLMIMFWVIAMIARIQQS